MFGIRVCDEGWGWGWCWVWVDERNQMMRVGLGLSEGGWERT